METPFLDQLIEEHRNHIESVEAASYAGIPETRKQLAELEAIKAIIVTHCCMSEAEQLSKRPNTTSTWECFTKAEKQQKDNV